ncbi:Tol-Pal system beta propeller repeat protein TolB [uncultured Algimonas sp.]|uniref:Tol-Pal system beta propeller repeat protein TolB n=1 Tax=uncultured Algimonas sp. TaxID=1547920 RepID=UPI002616CA49|nr:Tol-Pal system beta propeller repeat protein TolB [uncultured Algimonas sp.]
MIRLLSLFLALFGLCLPLAASAQIEVDITQGNVDPVPIAVPDFLGDDPETRELGAQIAGVIRDNLESSAVFRALDPASFLETQTDIDYEPTFADWRVIRADALVSGRVVRDSPGRVRVEFRLWDVFAGQQLEGIRFSTTAANWRRTAHKSADAIYKALTGEEGYFDSRIVFVDQRGPKVNREKRLAIMDQDGHDPQYLLGGSDLVVSPQFDPGSQTIVFMSYETLPPQVYMLDIETGRRELLGSFPGMTFAPRFSPSGDALVMSMEQRGNIDIYRMDLQTRSTERLTTDPGIDVSASYSPDGRRIVFQSDRGGPPQLYTMNADGSSPKRISFGDGRYNQPVWSPRGDKIAFVRQNRGKFSIGVMDPDGSNERILTDDYLLDMPSWSPNGRIILFTKETRGRDARAELWSVDLTGRNLKRVDTPGQATDPAWSPLLD